MLATKQSVQIFIAHVVNDLRAALLLDIPPALSKLFPQHPASCSQAHSQQQGPLGQVPEISEP